VLSIITIAFFMLLALGALLSATWAATLVALMFALEQGLQASSGFFISNVQFVNVFVGLVTVVSVATIVLRRPDELRHTVTFPLVATLIIYLWSAASMAWSPSTLHGPNFVRGGIPYIILFVILGPMLVPNIERMGGLMRLTLYMGSVLVTLLVANPNLTFYSGRLGLQIEGSVRSNPLAIGELGGSLILLATLLREGPRQWLMNGARIVAFLVGGLLALQSGSRGQLIFAVGLALVLLPVSKRIKNIFQFIATLIAVVVVVPLIVWLAQTFLYADVLGRWDTEQLSGGFAVRVLNDLDLIAVWAGNPVAWLAGLGFNAFAVVTTAGAKEHYPHNIFVELLAEGGLVMFVLLILVLLRTFRDGLWLFRRHSEQPVERATVSALLAMALYFFLIANKQNNLWGQGPMFMYCCMIARMKARTEEADALDPNFAHAMEPTDEGFSEDSPALHGAA
jgi:hypothetical protein